MCDEAVITELCELRDSYVVIDLKHATVVVDIQSQQAEVFIEMLSIK